MKESHASELLSKVFQIALQTTTKLESNLIGDCNHSMPGNIHNHVMFDAFVMKQLLVHVEKEDTKLTTLKLCDCHCAGGGGGGGSSGAMAQRS